MWPTSTPLQAVSSILHVKGVNTNHTKHIIKIQKLDGNTGGKSWWEKIVGKAGGKGWSLAVCRI